MSKAAIGYVHGHYTAAAFTASLTGLLRHRGQVELVDILTVFSGPNLADARNQLVRKFLDTSAEWLLMVDTDMVLPTDILDRLVAPGLAILGALCFMQSADGQELPTMQRLVHTSAGRRFERVTSWPEDTPVRVDVTGAGCLLVHRGVFGQFLSGWGDVDQVWPWFRETVLDEHLMLGEDQTFCLRAAERGIPVHVHTGVQVGHVKPSILGKVI